MSGRSVRARRPWFGVAGWCLAFSLMFSGTRASTAQDLAQVRRDLATSKDFRVRANAVVMITRIRPPDVRAVLIRALDDPHQAVRATAAASFASLGDPAAISVLQSHLDHEQAAPVKVQLSASIDKLKVASLVRSKPKYAVQFGAMKNLTPIRGEQLSQVMRSAALERAAAIPGAVLAEGQNLSIYRDAHIPVLMLDGSLMKMAQKVSSKNLAYSAQVEFSVRKVPEHVLRASFNGSATSYGAARALSHAPSLNALQDQAVQGAVESAMKVADQGLVQAVR